MDEAARREAHQRGETKPSIATYFTVIVQIEPEAAVAAMIDDPIATGPLLERSRNVPQMCGCARGFA
jgi:hypothetical protein